jgi:hypothetical protein
MPDSGAPPPPVAPLSHVVPWRNALAWYEEAMRLFKFAPLASTGLALVTIATELVLKAAPGAISLTAEIVAPLVACSLIYAAAAADRREAPSLRLVGLVFFAGGNAMVAVIASSLVAFVAEALAGWWIADANLFLLEGTPALSVTEFFGVYAIVTLAALPVTFVPPLVLFGRLRLRAAFAASFVAFAQNTVPLLVYGLAALVLLAFALLTAGLGLVVALPLWAAASYAAWKDVFGIRDAPIF